MQEVKSLIFRESDKATMFYKQYKEFQFFYGSRKTANLWTL